MVAIKQTSSMADAAAAAHAAVVATVPHSSLPSAADGVSDNSKRLSHALNVATLSSLSSLSADDIRPLTKTGSTWIVHLSGFFKPPKGRQDFYEMYECHPKEKHPIKVFDKQTYENRFSQLYVTDNSIGDTYRYSGTTRKSIICDQTVDDQQFVIDLCHMADTIVSKITSIMNVARDEEDKRLDKNDGQDDQEEEKEKSATKQSMSLSSSSSASVTKEEKVNQLDDKSTTGTSDDAENHDEIPIPKSLYNCCLVNWYEPEHSIGLHSDDQMEMNPNAPIISLSWGGPRRFLLRPKKHMINDALMQRKKLELLLKDGDLLIMGGNCQQEFKHEVPKVRQMDGLVENRISWTIRSNV